MIPAPVAMLPAGHHPHQPPTYGSSSSDELDLLRAGPSRLPNAPIQFNSSRSHLATPSVYSISSDSQNEPSYSTPSGTVDEAETTVAPSQAISDQAATLIQPNGQSHQPDAASVTEDQAAISGVDAPQDTTMTELPTSSSTPKNKKMTSPEEEALSQELIQTLLAEDRQGQHLRPKRTSSSQARTPVQTSIQQSQDYDSSLSSAEEEEDDLPSSSKRKPLPKKSPTKKKVRVANFELASPAASSSRKSPGKAKSKAAVVAVSSSSDQEAGPSSSGYQGQAAASKKKNLNKKSADFIAPAYRFIKDGRYYEYQVSRCQSQRYSAWPKCCHCTSKVTGDTCRFQWLRVFPLKLVNGDLRPLEPNSDADLNVAAPFLADEPEKNIVPFQYPEASSLYPPANTGSSRSLKAIAAQSLLPTMRQELAHAQQEQTLWRKPEVDFRPQCEYCLTSIFSASFLCRRCGKEYCLDCAAAFASHDQSAKVANSLFLCVQRRQHTATYLCPMTRLRVDELKDEITQMEAAAAQAQDAVLPKAQAAASRAAAIAAKLQDTSTSTGDSQELDGEKQYSGLEADAMIGSHPLTTFSAASLDESTFQTAWSRGEPIVVTGCLPKVSDAKPEDATSGESSQNWGPHSFTQAPYDEEDCYITRCDKDNIHQVVKVPTFFETFGKSAQEKREMLGQGVWKLKDWPPGSSFKAEFPRLYEHFNQTLPIPSYTRRDGRMNISALFPLNGNAPDLGPKMYNAWPSEENQTSKGSTRLHMDVADAVNVMYHAATPTNVDELPSDHPYRQGVAAWDIFPAEDAQAVRGYLSETRASVLFAHEDPIHSQRHFLDPMDRIRLWERGVRSWRIYQKQGEAVFIPAGCAHQVCNLTDCMKIAVDFVSPENVARCFQLTKEFRALSNDTIKSWKEDILQLKAMLWHAWRGSRIMEGHDYSKQEKGKSPQASTTNGTDEKFKATLSIPARMDCAGEEWPTQIASKSASTSSSASSSRSQFVDNKESPSVAVSDPSSSTSTPTASSKKASPSKTSRSKALPKKASPSKATDMDLDEDDQEYSPDLQSSPSKETTTTSKTAEPLKRSSRSAATAASSAITAAYAATTDSEEACG